MDLETIEKMLYHKSASAKKKGKTIISYNLLLGILDQINKLHRYNEMKSMFDSMYKSNIEMSDKLTQVREELRKATEERSKTKVGLLEKQIKSALRYLEKATWMDSRERNDLINILGEKYDRPD